VPSSSSSPRSEERYRGSLIHPRRQLALVQIFHGCQLDAPCGLAHPDRRHRRLRLDLRATYEHQLHMANEGAGREAPASVSTVVRHAPLHRSLEVPQRLGGQGIDALGDPTLRLWQASDVGENGFVAFCSLRGACPARHGNRQFRGGSALGGLLTLALGVLRCFGR
jgi:hypothetical protein